MFNGILGKILGNNSVVKDGMKMLDDAFYTDSEKAEDKAKMETYKSKHKIKLLKAYAPFKVAQRYIAIVFLFCFTLSFIGILIATGFEVKTAPYLKVIEAFNIQWITMTIVMFYFGGGLADSIKKGGNK